jgi:DNA invertase Pin-like site-specific DNA recombinase
MTKAYSYLRFSTPEQMKGDSLRRQSQLALEYVARHGLELDDQLTLHDLGVSAFRGRNARQGALGAFLMAVDDGLVPQGSYLLVESLDRVTRQDPWDALPLFQQIINAGVVIVTLQDGKTYSREEMRANPLRILESLFVMIRANEESATKSRRLSAAWIGKRSRAKERPLTAIVPAWLRLNRATGTFEVIEERAEIVRRIFRMTLEGTGQGAIAERLNRENVPTFGGTKRPAKHWHRSYVVKIVENPAVFGTLVPRTLDYSSGRRVRKPLDPIPGYYPAVIDEDTFKQAQTLRMGSRSPLRGRHAGSEVRNVLGGMALCPSCGSSMTRVSKGSGSKASKPYLVCSKAKAGAGCKYHAVPYQEVEEALLRLSGDLVAQVPAGAEGVIDEELRELDRRIDAAQEALERYLDAIASGQSASLTARIRSTEQELDALRAARASAVIRRDAVAGPMIRRKLDQLLTALKAEPFDRSRANVALRQLLSGVVVDHPEELLRFRWKHGGETALPLVFSDTFTEA